MGRKENRKMAKLQGEKISKKRSDKEFMIVKGSSQYMKKEREDLEDLLIKLTKYDEPKGNMGLMMMFVKGFMTPEMAQDFPDLAKEYLTEYNRCSGITDVEEDFLIRDKEGEIIGFKEMPYFPCDEKRLEDAYNYRVLMKMLISADSGSVYSKDFLIALYKRYHKSEYESIKRLNKLSVIETMNIFYERDKTVEIDDHLLDLWLPSFARIMMMAHFLEIEFSELFFKTVSLMNNYYEEIIYATYKNQTDYQRAKENSIELSMEKFVHEFPEVFNHFELQNKEYMYLKIAKHMLGVCFGEYGLSCEMVYNSCHFDLRRLAAKVLEFLSLSDYIDTEQVPLNELLLLSMIQYLSECLCEMAVEREKELEALLCFKRVRFEGEWRRDDTEKEHISNFRKDKVIRAVEESKSKKVPEIAVKKEPCVDSDKELLREENCELKKTIEEKENMIRELEWKLLSQRDLYENARAHEKELEQKIGVYEDEHMEIISLRNFLYEQKNIEEDTEELGKSEKERIIQEIRDKKVAVLGGTDKWTKKMKKILPSWSFVSVNEGAGSGGLLALERADYIYIYTSVLKHEEYRRAMHIVNSQRKTQFYLDTTNIDENLRRFLKDLCPQVDINI